MSLRHWWQLNKLRVLNYELLATIDQLAEIHRDIEAQGGGFTPAARAVRDFLTDFPRR